MTIAIVDDNKTEQNKLSKSISDWANKNCIQIQAECFNSAEVFLNAFKSKKFDIVFMDIIMDGKNGIEAARLLRKISIETMLIFITSSPEFMYQAFPCHAFDYILKPYANDRINEVLDEALRVLGKQGEVTIIAGEKFLLSDILYVYSDSNYCEIHGKQKTKRVRLPFSDVAKQLTQFQSFMIVSRGAAVNFDNTIDITDSYCVMNNGERITISRRKTKEVEQRYMDRQFSKLLSEGK